VEKGREGGGAWKTEREAENTTYTLQWGKKNHLVKKKPLCVSTGPVRWSVVKTPLQKRTKNYGLKKQEQEGRAKSAVARTLGCGGKPTHWSPKKWEKSAQQ